MGFASRPAALVLLSCCLVLGFLMGFTGLAKDSHLTESRPTEPAAAKAGLRGVHELSQPRRALTPDGGVGPLELEADETKEESLESVLWPELEGKTGGLWGPDDEERLQLELEANKDAAAVDTEASFWGAGVDERDLLAEALLNGNWDRLMDVDMDMDGSFSFSYEM